MKIVLVETTDSGHHSEYIHLIAAALSASGAQVSFVGHPRIAEQLQHAFNIPVQSVPEPDRARLGAYVFGILGAVSAFRTALRFARRNEARIHFMYLDRNILALWLAFLLTNPSKFVTASLHWGYLLKSHPAQGAARIVRRLERFLLRRLVGRGLRVIVHSDILKVDLESELGSTGFVSTPYSVAKVLFQDQHLIDIRTRLGIPHNCELLLCFGGTRHGKGVDTAIRALGLLPRTVHLLVAGPEQHFTREVLKRIADESGASDRVHYDLRFIPESEVVSYFVTSNIVLLPYRDYFAGQSGPLLLGGSLGIPAISTDLPILSETIEQYGLGQTVQTESPESLAEGITKLLDSEHKVDSSEVQRFQYDHDAMRFVEALRALDAP